MFNLQGARFLQIGKYTLFQDIMNTEEQYIIICWIPWSSQSVLWMETSQKSISTPTYSNVGGAYNWFYSCKLLIEKFRHITPHCALVCLKLEFEPECYKGRISLMRKAMNDSFSFAESKKLWLQASTFVYHCQCKGECVWRCWFTCYVILRYSFVTDNALGKWF